MKNSSNKGNSGVKYTPILRSTQALNPFDEDVAALGVASRASNPFDDDYQEIELAPRSITVASTHNEGRNPFDEPPLPPPPPSRAPRRNYLNQTFASPPRRTASSHPSRAMRPPEPPSNSNSPNRNEDSRIERNHFRAKLTKIDQKLQKDQYDQISEVCYNPSDEQAIIRFLVAKRVYGYPGTNGGVLSNYCHYVYNNHPLFGICCLHPLNPFGRKERILVFCNSLFFAIFITFLITETTFVPKLSTCRLPCHQYLPVNGTATLCQGGYNDGVSYDHYREACVYYSPWMLSAICGICIVVYQSLLEFLGTCGCVQGKKTFRNNCCGSRIKGCVESLGGSLLTFATVVSVSFLIWAIAACYLLGVSYAILGNIVLSKVWSIGEWFIWSSPYFAYRYPIDRKHFYQRLLRKEGTTSETVSSKNTTTTVTLSAVV